MGQVASHISGYFSQQSKQEVKPVTSTHEKFVIKERKFCGTTKYSEGFNFSNSFGIVASPRNPLKRTRLEEALSVSVPQPILDIFSPPKKAKIDIDEYLDYPFICHWETIEYYRKSKTLIILRGLPGSGKSTIVKHLERKFQSMKVCSADQFFMKDGEYVYDRDLIKDAHAQCQRNAIAAVRDQVPVVVIDNTNVKLWEMKFYLDLATEFNYVPVIVEPRTPWSRDVPTLTDKTTHSLNEKIVQLKHDSFDELLPVYYAWFINERDSVSVLEEGEMWIEEAYKIPEFRKDFEYHTGTTTVEDLVEYYETPGKGRILHITAKYAGRSRSPDNLDYIESKCVKNAVGKAFDVHVVGFVLTPRTLGARIRLTERQLALWAKDDEEEVPAEFWEVERPDEDPLAQVVDQAELSAEKANGDGHLPNGNGAFNSDSEDGDPGVVVISDGESSAHESQASQDGSGSNPPVTAEKGQEDTVDGPQDESPVKEVTPTPEQNGDASPKIHTPPKPLRTSPRKGHNSPKKQNTVVQIPVNELDIDDSLTKSTWKGIPSDSSVESRFAPTTGKGSRAHITLGCAPEVKAVTTGLDLIMASTQERTAQAEPASNHDESTDSEQNKSAAHTIPNGESVTTAVTTFPVSGGVARNYGNGVWVFYPDEALVAQSIFSIVS